MTHQVPPHTSAAVRADRPELTGVSPTQSTGTPPAAAGDAYLLDSIHWLRRGRLRGAQIRLDQAGHRGVSDPARFVEVQLALALRAGDALAAAQVIRDWGRVISITDTAGIQRVCRLVERHPESTARVEDALADALLRVGDPALSRAARERAIALGTIEGRRDLVVRSRARLDDTRARPTHDDHRVRSGDRAVGTRERESGRSLDQARGLDTRVDRARMPGPGLATPDLPPRAVSAPHVAALEPAVPAARASVSLGR